MTNLGMKVRCVASTRVTGSEKLEQDGQEEQREFVYRPKFEVNSINPREAPEIEKEETYIRSTKTYGHQSPSPSNSRSISPIPVEHLSLREASKSKKEKTNTESPKSTRSRSLSLSTSDSTSHTSETKSKNPNETPHNGLSCVQEAQLSIDGSCIFTSDYDRTFSVYPVDSSILSSPNSHSLKPYASLASSNPIWAFAASPFFNCQDASTTNILISRRDSYITLHNALWDIKRSHNEQITSPFSPVDISTPITSYKLINHLTEAVIAPISLSYDHTGTHFFAGKQNSIATFDLEHTNEPIHTISTIPSKRNKLKGGGRGFKGWISALALTPPTSVAQGGLLAAGARTRYIGIYDAIGGTDVTHFALPGVVNGKKSSNETLRDIMGGGISSLKWSPCGRYLYVAERQSDALLIYDVRNFSLCLGYCVGRKALTRQKLGFDVWNAGPAWYDIEAVAHEVWAGGTDGCVRIWKDPCMKEGPIEADDVVYVDDGSMPVVASLVHSSGSMAVAACGSVDLGGEKGGSRKRNGGVWPSVRECGSVSILGLS